MELGRTDMPNRANVTYCYNLLGNDDGGICLAHVNGVTCDSRQGYTACTSGNEGTNWACATTTWGTNKITNCTSLVGANSL